MAARRGEPAFEVDPLGHGLFTYTLLRGLGSIKPGNEPEEIAKFRLPANADFNHDGILSITELDAYVSQNLKAIAAVFPEIVVRREADLPVGPRVPAGKLEQHPVLQSFGTPFPLIPLTPQPRPSRRQLMDESINTIKVSSVRTSSNSDCRIRDSESALCTAMSCPLTDSQTGREDRLRLGSKRRLPGAAR